eukprot:350136-Chlamydomonas_euryale.AAC.9
MRGCHDHHTSHAMMPRSSHEPCEDATIITQPCEDATIITRAMRGCHDHHTSHARMQRSAAPAACCGRCFAAMP